MYKQLDESAYTMYGKNFRHLFFTMRLSCKSSATTTLYPNCWRYCLFVNEYLNYMKYDAFVK